MRLISLLVLDLASVLLAALLSGCGTSDQPAQPTPEAAAGADNKRTETVDASDVPAVDAESSSQKTEEPASGAADVAPRQEPEATPTDHAPPDGIVGIPVAYSEGANQETQAISKRNPVVHDHSYRPAAVGFRQA